MKTLLLPVLLLLLMSNGISQNSQGQPLSAAISKKENTKKDPLANIDRQWQSLAEQYITTAEYDFKKDGNNPVFYAANRAQRLGFSVDASGYTISPEVFLDKKTMHKNWTEIISFAGIQRGREKLKGGKPYSFEQNKSVLSYRYPGFLIQYINNEKGLRQNFLVNKKLPGSQNLEVLLKYKGPMDAAIGQGGIEFSNKGITKLFYEDLKVWDADQQILPARFELRENNIIAIIVADSGARYPLTIDPLNKVPEWTGTAEGILPPIVGQLAIDAAYGYSVAGVGDVNADGFDDVAIGAPAMVDVISGTGALAGVGAVFVYYGSAGGLPVAPSAMLQPTTAVAGALFGYSIAGGDVNNDGNADIIVGAPLDNIIVNGQSGTIGKAYVFDGATLSTNTTPFLSIQLSGNSIIKEGINLSVNALFGFSVAVTEDLNGDGKNDMIVGAPTYAGIKNDLFGNPTLLDVQSGGAFVFLTNAGNNNLNIVKLKPITTNLLGILSFNINGLLFGYSVDGLGDYNNDGHPDVVATAPAGIDLGLISLLLNGKLLQGSATVYYGTGAGVDVDPGAVLTATSGGLLTNLTGSIGNIANLFGTSVRAVRDAAGVRNGNLLVGAPLGGALMNVLSLQLKTGTVNVFVKKTTSPAGNVIPDQILSSPRNSNAILSIIQCNLLFGYSLDNIRDINCDGFADIIVGEPASSGAQLINANVAGGAVYVYFGKGDGTYNPAPNWNMTAEADAFLGINGTAMIGYSVAGAGKVRGAANANYIFTGSPSRTLDFGTGLLNLGNTFGTLFGLAAADNGVGKAFLFEANLCTMIFLPVTITEFKAVYNAGISHLYWITAQESNSSHFEIERSVDGINFSSISIVAAAGNSNHAINYAFNDQHPAAGNNYYRLKMQDIDGNFVYSNIVSVNVRINGNALTAVYPSPFIDKINLVVASETATQANVVIFDNAGKQVTSYTTWIHKSINHLVIEKLDNLASGFYIIKVSLDEQVLTRKLVK
ncbi:MAG: T9SS type A sorting domain-containing protein [Ferruginibacter sp.]